MYDNVIVLKRERESEKKRETGQNIVNKIKYLKKVFLIQNCKRPKRRYSKFKSYINRILIPESLREKWDKK